MKMAQARENRKDNKGFSLVELIIVIAIMVALVAMLAPQFVKYVQRSRDAVVGDAAESVLSMVKSEAALNNISVATGVTATVTIECSGGNGPIFVDQSGVTITPVAKGGEYASWSDFVNDCGIDMQKSTKSDLKYTITIVANSSTGGYLFSMEPGTRSGS